jgi:hypothetical protein
MSNDEHKAPFPWFGGKRRAAPIVWQLLGDVPHYVEPFAGSLAVLLNRPHLANRPYFSETVNDLDGFVVNAWRAIQWAPEDVAAHASWPVTEADKQARQIACLKWRTETTLERLAGSAEWFDSRIAGWWLYGVACQIGAFSGDGPWTVDPDTGRIHKQARTGLREPGVSRDLPQLADNGRGVNHAGLREPGVKRDFPHLSGGQGVNKPQLREPGVSRNLPHLTTNGQGVNHAGLREPGVLSDDPGNEFHPLTMPNLTRWMQLLSARLRHVRIVNGDWTRVVTTGAAHTIPVRMGDGPAGVFLDPPYDSQIRSKGLYQSHDGADDGSVAADVRAWCARVGDHPLWRIVLAGYDTEHGELEALGWTCHEWFTDGYLTGGMGNVAGKDAHQQKRERLWASPHCLPLDLNEPTHDQQSLFD